MPEQELKQKAESAFDRREEVQVDPVLYSDEEKQYDRFLRNRLMLARDQRNQEHIEFDDMTYIAWHEENAKAANSYNPPRKNEEDTRIVTGTTSEKESTLLSTLLNFNFGASITAFDKNDIEIRELGNVMEDLVEKSRRMENYEDRRRLYYKEFLDQGTCFVEEVTVEQIVFDKKLKNPNWTMGGVNLGS